MTICNHGFDRTEEELEDAELAAAVEAREAAIKSADDREM